MEAIVIATGVLVLVGIIVVLVALWLKIALAERHFGQRIDHVETKLDRILDEIRLARGRSPRVNGSDGEPPPAEARRRGHLWIVPAAVMSWGGRLVDRIRDHPRRTALVTATALSAVGAITAAVVLLTPSTTEPAQVQDGAPSATPMPSAPHVRRSPTPGATSRTPSAGPPTTAAPAAGAGAGDGTGSSPSGVPTARPSTGPPETTSPPVTGSPTSAPPANPPPSGHGRCLHILILGVCIGH